MSLISAALPIPTHGVRFAKVFPRFDELGAAGQRLWIYLWEKTAFGTRPARLTDREIAEACGRGIRWVQKALAQLLDLEEDGVPTPAIDRFRQYGPRHLAGRVIQIIVDFAKPAENPAATRAKPRPKPTAPARAPAPPPTPAAPPTPAEPRPTPEEARRAAVHLRGEIARIKAETDALRAAEQARQTTAGPPSLPSKPIKGVDSHSKPIKGVDPHNLNYLEVKEKLGALTEPEKARLDAARANRGP
jgi:pyruvate/2-oxoglutarate dehydrogenase complex dihydrolipoamide acyltransferase (E2) component